MFLIFSLLVLFSETWVTGTKEATTSIADTVAEPTRLEPEIPVIITKGTTNEAEPVKKNGSLEIKR